MMNTVGYGIIMDVLMDNHGDTFVPTTKAHCYQPLTWNYWPIFFITLHLTFNVGWHDEIITHKNQAAIPLIAIDHVGNGVVALS